MLYLDFKQGGMDPNQYGREKHRAIDFIEIHHLTPWNSPG